MRKQKKCVSCGNDFGWNELFEHFAKQGDNRIYCYECQTKNYLVIEHKTTAYHLLHKLINIFWLLGAIAGFYVFHLALKGAPFLSLRLGHFVMAFLGALLGVLVGRFFKKYLRWVCGTLHQSDNSSDYDL